MDVSVIIPVHNNENTLIRAMESVLSQITNNDELIIVINGSTDNSESIAQKYVYDDRVKIIQSQSGRSRARNKGIASARGKFLNFLDADDMMMPNHIKHAKKFLVNNGDYDAYTDETLIVNGNRQYVSIKYTPQTTSLHLSNNNIFEVGSVMFKNKNIIPFIDELEYNEDYVFWIDNLMGKKVFFNSTFIGVHKFIDGNNTMIKNRNDMIATQIIVIAILKQKKVLKNSFNYIELTKRVLKFLLGDSSNEERLLAIVNSQFRLIVVLSKVILKMPIIGKIVVLHYS